VCGIAGFLEQGKAAYDVRAALEAMVGAVAHRGPDAAGSWFDASSGVALGHRRLSILELSESGSQPMESPSGRYVIVFNGEIYNHLDLRAAVGAVTWHGRSDTESLLVALERFGVTRTLEMSVGMFAFAVWDRQDASLTLARDRLGEKPLYYGWQGNTLLFGSELKALKGHPSFRFEIDPAAVAAYLKYGYVPAPYSIYAGIKKLLPGHSWRIGPPAGGRQGQLTQYWSLAEVARNARPFRGGDQEAVDELEELLGRSIAGQRVADVPLGAFLSGGVDSSAVVALMQRQSTIPVRTFTIGFSESEFDESAGARAVANHLGTDHTEITVTPQESRDVIPMLPRLFDEPFGDASAIPTWLLAGLARKDVTVSLSGDGGDELFGGYGRYHRTAALWQRAAALGPSGRAVVRAALATVPTGAVQSALVRAHMGSFPHLFESRVQGVRAAFAEGPVDSAYDRRMSLWPEPAALLRRPAPGAPIWAQTVEVGRRDPTERMMAFDTLSYLPDDVLVKVDRAAMAHGLETRVPLLDHRLVEFAWRLPQALRVREGSSKWILRQLLYRYVPRELVDRPKQGFGVPIGAWLRGPLQGWAEELLSTDSLDAGLLKAQPIRKMWREHLSGAANWEHRLWPVLVLQEWTQHERTAPRLRSGVTSVDVGVPG
jgi:asparagine synthase (glutamine-hydrolysing)